MKPRVAALIVLAVAVAVWLPSLRNGFAYDDHVVIRLNERLHDLSRAHLIFAQSYWPDTSLGLYRPLASFTFAIDWAIGSGTALWFHIMNVVWNAAACVLLFALLLQFIPVGAALLGALVFAVHPVHVEAVANVVGRSELMAAVFCLAAMLLWVDREEDEKLSTRRLAAIAVLYLCAMMSKESAIMLPVLCALADAARNRLRPDTFLAWVRRHVPAIVVLGVTSVLFLALRTLVLGELGPQRVDPTLDVASATGDRIRTALQGWPHVIRLLVYPRTLLSDYGPRILMPAMTWTPLSLLGAVIFLAMVVGGLVAWARGRGLLAFVLLFLPISLLPVSNLIVPIGVIVAERALYLPSLAFAAGAAFAAAYVWEQRARAAMIALTALVAVLFTIRTLDRIPTWRSTGAVFQALRTDRPDSFRAAWHAARVAANREDVPTALQWYAYTLNLWPYRHNVVIEAASYAANNGDLAFAQRITDYALQRWPDDVDVLRLRAGVALDLADTVTARTMIARGLAREPQDSLLRSMQAALQGTR
jgi:hypothetical protein